MFYLKQNVNPSKRVRVDGVFLGLAGCSLGFPSSFAIAKSIGTALPALGKSCPCLLFYLDLTILRSWLNISVSKILTFSPGLENSHTLKFCSDNIPTSPHIIICPVCWKIVRPIIQCNVVLQSRREDPKKQTNYETNLSPIFYKNQDLLPWIEEQQ